MQEQPGDGQQHVTDWRTLLLEPGTYLVEVGFDRPITSACAVEGFEAIGFEEPTLDASQDDRVEPIEAASPAEEERLERLSSSYDDWADLDRIGEEAIARIRFVAVVPEAILLQDTGSVRWLRTQGISFDPFADVRKTVVPFTLQTGHTYDVRFVSRMKAHATRSRVLATLAIMGFMPRTLSCLKKHIRFEGRPGTDCALWCGRVVWQGPRTVLTVEDPLVFEDVEDVTALDASGEIMLEGSHAAAAEELPHEVPSDVPPDGGGGSDRRPDDDDRSEHARL